MVEVAGTMPPPQKVQSAQATQQPSAGDPTKGAASRTVTAPFQISTMQTRDRWLKMLVYGGHGKGKTALLGSAVDIPMMRDVLMVDAESGDTTIWESDRIKNPELIHHIQATNFKQVAFVQEFLKAYCAARDRNDVAVMRKLYAQVTGVELENPPRFRTVIVDSITEIEAYCQYQILNIDEDKILKDDGDDIISGWPEFRKNFEMVKLLIRAFRDLPMHVLFSAAEGYSQDESKKYHYAPQLTGKLSVQSQGFFDIVGWVRRGSADAETGVAPTRVFVQPIEGGPRFDAKNRWAAYKKAWFDDPTMETIMRGIGLYRDEPDTTVK